MILHWSVGYWLNIFFTISALTRVPIKKNQMGQMQKLLPANVTGNFPIWLFLSSCSQGFNRKKVLFSLIFTFVLSGLLLFCKVCFILDLYFSRLFCSGKFNSAKKQILPLILLLILRASTSIIPAKTCRRKNIKNIYNYGNTSML